MSSASKPARKAKSVPIVPPAEEPNVSTLPFPIVGIGASAGGLEAFTKLLHSLPANTGMAFVLVQHLDPHHESQLTILLTRATTMPVQQVKNGMVIKPDHVYVIPPNANMNLARGRLRLTPRGNARLPHPVDHFFSSLAREQQNWAIGVVLSGTGSDGTIGMKDIKEAGGITFAQDEESARFSGMPMQAAGDTVDFILPPEKIALELARIGHDPCLAETSKTKTQVEEAAQAKKFLRILSLLRARTGVDLSQYRDTTIKRRIQRRMVVRRRHTLDEYLELLEKEPGEIHSLFDDVLINVTGFFRDPEVYEALKSHIFPEIVKAAPQTIRIWVAACSTGQEAYSLAIILLEFLEQNQLTREIQIFATDLSESIAIDKGRRGVYPESIEAEVPPERLRRFFTKEDGSYRISKTIRDMCIFAKQNIISDPPFSRMDLVSCRNLLIYFTSPLQKQLISTFHYALNSPGWLLLGQSENVSTNSDLFELVDRKHKIFSKKGAALRPFSHFATQEMKSGSVAARPGATRQASAPGDFQKEADRILLGRYAPAGVLVNSNLEILQFRGRTSPYLEPASGEASFNLLKMARDNLSLELAPALREAKKTSLPVRRNVRFQEQEVIRKVNLEVLPVKLSTSAENCYLVLFKEGDRERDGLPIPKTIPLPEMPLRQKDKEMKRLHAELAAAREYLQVTIEQQEAASEELKCANEEVLSSNEELQSTNEQLGTAKEELQSTNEELHTLNEELQTRNIELNQINNDLANLLATLQIPILMLGNDLRVRRFNAAAVELFNLKATTVGRAIHAVDSPLITTNLETLLLEVIGRVAPKEMEIRDREGRWFSLRLHPYRTSDNRIDGVVMAVVDIDELKRAQEKLLDYVTAMVDTARAPLLVLRADLRVNMANDAFYNLFQIPKARTENRLIYELGDEWDIPELRRLLAEITTGLAVLKDFEITREFAEIGRRTLRFNARRLEQKKGAELMIILSMEDITEWKQIQETNRWLAAIVESTDDAVISENLAGTIVTCNQGATRLYGYAPEELIGQSVLNFGPPALPEEQAKILESIQEGKTKHHYETVRPHKDGSTRDVSVTVSPVRDINGKIIGISKISRDISERKRAEIILQESLQREKTAREAAEMASRAKDDFLAVLSHELRTPLNPALLIASDSARDPDLAPQVRANFDTIRKSVELEARLIDDLLDMTRISCGKVGLEMLPRDAHAVLQEVVASLQGEMEDKHLHLQVNLKAKRHKILGDAVRLQQIFGNVLKNSVKFTPPGGKILITTTASKETGKFRLNISDSGIGLTEAELKQIFASFSQGEHATRTPHRFGGLGLGLAIARKLVELHDGVIHAASDGPHKGATFTVELPLTSLEETSTPPEETPPPAPAHGQKEKTARHRILVIEDHEPTRNALRHLLVRRRHTVLTAGSLAEARALTAREKIDFVISDIGLPDGNGNDLMQELSQKFGLKGVALTGYGTEQDIQRSLTAGFVAHLTKPVRIQALEKVLSNPALTP
jgi:two-component system CheB/CheR fusion protein